MSAGWAWERLKPPLRDHEKPGKCSSIAEPQIYTYTTVTGKNSVGLASIGNITFPFSTTHCLNLEIVLSGFQQKGLPHQVRSLKYHSPQDLHWVSLVLLWLYQSYQAAISSD